MVFSSIFSHYFFEYSFSPFLFSFISRALIIKMLDLLLLSHRFLRLCSIFFRLFFSLLIRLGKFYWYALKFTDSIHCYFHSTLSPPNEFLISVIVSFSSTISIWIFIISVSLLRISIFSCLSGIFIIDHWSVLMTAALKSLQHSSNIWFNLVLVSVDSFLIQIVIFLVIDMASNFLLYPLDLGYYTRRILILCFFVCFCRLSFFLGLACWSWPTFVFCGSGSSDNLFFSTFVVLFWSTWLIWCCWHSH